MSLSGGTEGPVRQPGLVSAAVHSSLVGHGVYESLRHGSSLSLLPPSSSVPFVELPANREGEDGEEEEGEEEGRGGRGSGEGGEEKGNIGKMTKEDKCNSIMSNRISCINELFNKSIRCQLLSIP